MVLWLVSNAQGLYYFNLLIHSFETHLISYCGKYIQAKVVNNLTLFLKQDLNRHVI